MLWLLSMLNMVSKVFLVCWGVFILQQTTLYGEKLYSIQTIQQQRQNPKNKYIFHLKAGLWNDNFFLFVYNFTRFIIIFLQIYCILIIAIIRIFKSRSIIHIPRKLTFQFWLRMRKAKFSLRKYLKLIILRFWNPKI